MLTDKILEFIAGKDFAFVATANGAGVPHIATARSLQADANGQLIFENWFCLTTLENAAVNPQVAVVVADPATGCGYQFIGRIVKFIDVAVLNGYAPELEKPGGPQALTSLTIQSDKVMEFSSVIHSDMQLP
ncbi:pyridoxamine 5'-phosphate oxidase [Geobacter sp. OR-1]|uniref:pyridoxamine 5'-phosphate oxidase family protein n=1 Tax=Geobacter sp. OR-1 TaxID=1266765 RepID=UPI000543C9BB|nr:pyridoxamine 5'-phosphate oxidase family protein [Geobacter sp. OR-1]GAM09359.1 pyridoxamine 5'-phosphate oxidase [Geobacter sp. OR-1]